MVQRLVNWGYGMNYEQKVLNFGEDFYSGYKHEVKDGEYDFKLTHPEPKVNPSQLELDLMVGISEKPHKNNPKQLSFDF